MAKLFLNLGLLFSETQVTSDITSKLWRHGNIFDHLFNETQLTSDITSIVWIERVGPLRKIDFKAKKIHFEK